MAQATPLAFCARAANDRKALGSKWRRVASIGPLSTNVTGVCTGSSLSMLASAVMVMNSAPASL